jgi:hypothetical protein
MSLKEKVTGFFSRKRRFYIDKAKGGGWLVYDVKTGDPLDASPRSKDACELLAIEMEERGCGARKPYKKGSRNDLGINWKGLVRKRGAGK